jgi:hypothetical protein
VEKNFDAEIGVVVEVDDVGCEFGKQAFDLAGEARVLVGEFEPIKSVGGVNVFVIRIGLGEGGAEFFGAGGTVAAEEPGFAVGVCLDGTEELKRGDFRAAVGDFGVAVGGDEDARGGAGDRPRGPFIAVYDSLP